MFRFNNPDALLVLMLVAGAYCLTRALERAGTRWILAAGALIGFAFLAKMMQAFLVLPAFALVYLIAAPTGLCAAHLAAAGAGAGRARSARGWWVAIVALWPAGSRPVHRRLARQQHPQPHLRLQRLRAHLRSSGGPGGGGGGGANFSGATGPLRLFNDLMGGQASWLLPGRAARAGRRTLVAAGTHRGPIASVQRCCCGAAGCSSPRPSSASARASSTPTTRSRWPPPSARWSRSAARCSGEHRDRPAARALAALAVAGSSGWALRAARAHAVLAPWLRPLVIASAACPRGHRPARGCPRTCSAARGVSFALAAARGVAMLAGPLAYAAETVTTPHTGSIPSAGPALSASRGGGARGGGPPGAATGARHPRRRSPAAQSGGGAFGAGATRCGRGAPAAVPVAIAAAGPGGAAPPHSITSCWRRLSVTPRITAGSPPPSVRRRRPASSWPPAASP